MSNFCLIPNAFKWTRGINEDKAGLVSDAESDVDVAGIPDSTIELDYELA